TAVSPEGELEDEVLRPQESEESEEPWATSGWWSSCTAPAAFSSGFHQDSSRMLASEPPLCLIHRVSVQLKSRILQHQGTHKSFLSLLLGLLLLATTTLAVCHALHQTVHQNGALNHFCLVCTFAKGLVTTAEAAACAGPLVGCWLLSKGSVSILLPSGPLKGLPQSRAPPPSA